MIKPIKSLTAAAVLTISFAAVPTLQAAEHKTPSAQGSMMAEVLDRLGTESQRIAPFFITVDPTRDTPAVMKEYVQAFHPDLIGLTGTEAETAAAAYAFRVYYEKMEEASAPDGYLMAHSGHIYLMTPDGRYEAVFRDGEQSAQELASQIIARMNR
jgi:protein SCO1/2